MKRIHILRVESPASAFAPLVAEIASRGEKIGWLDWYPGTIPEAPVSLSEAAELGALRAVAINDGGSIAVKKMTGPPVLRDVIREHFRGCVAVLVRSSEPSLAGQAPFPGFEYPAPFLSADAQGFETQVLGRRFQDSVAKLSDRLRRPRPFQTEPVPV